MRVRQPCLGHHENRAQPGTAPFSHRHQPGTRGLRQELFEEGTESEIECTPIDQSPFFKLLNCFINILLISIFTDL